MNNNDDSPALSKPDQKTGDEPMLSKRITKGLGTRQIDFLQFLVDGSKDANEQRKDVSWLEAWIWVGERTGYLYGSKASQNRMHEYIGKTTYALVKSLEKRGLVIVITSDSGKTIRVLIHND